MRYDADGFAGAKWFEANDYKFSHVRSFRSLADIQDLVDKDNKIVELQNTINAIKLEMQKQEFVFSEGGKVLLDEGIYNGIVKALNSSKEQS